MAELPESFWDNLLDYIQDRTVIPVIGPELVTVREGGLDVPLYRWVAQRLAADLKLPTAELPEGFDLNDVVSMHVRSKKDQQELYGKIHRMLRNAALTPNESLRALAGIPGLNLFVSLTFDSLLADALGATQLVYSPNKICDLPSEKKDLRQPVVFHLLGKASSSSDYAICDEDLLELLHAMQDKQRQPKMLFDEMRGNHLLILGCNFGDWLARFFLRTARSLELSRRRKRWDMLVGDQIAQDAKLALFLESFSSDTHMIPLTAAQFVTELAKRWQDAHPAEAQSPEPAGREASAALRSLPTGTIFVSYAREDLEAASRLAEGLRSANLDIWFDQIALQPGDDWPRSIRRGIERCSLFLPVISHQTLSDENLNRSFRQEWDEADERARAAPTETFIIPVVIDDTRMDRALLPSTFKRAQGQSLPDGNVTHDFVERLQGLVRDFHRLRTGGVKA